MNILLIVIGSVILAAIITVASMRFLVRIFGISDLMENGFRITQNGIEYFYPPFLGVREHAFKDIDSVELVAYRKLFCSKLLPLFLLRNRVSVSKIPPIYFGKVLIIRLKNPTPIEYLFFAPKNAESFLEKLKQQIIQT